MTDPRMLKCRFCEWRTPAFLRRRGGGPPISGMSMLLRHVEEKHEEEADSLRDEVEACSRPIPGEPS